MIKPLFDCTAPLSKPTCLHIGSHHAVFALEFLLSFIILPSSFFFLFLPCHKGMHRRHTPTCWPNEHPSLLVDSPLSRQDGAQYDGRAPLIAVVWCATKMGSLVGRERRKEAGQKLKTRWRHSLIAKLLLRFGWRASGVLAWTTAKPLEERGSVEQIVSSNPPQEMVVAAAAEVEATTKWPMCVLLSKHFI